MRTRDFWTGCWTITLAAGLALAQAAPAPTAPTHEPAPPTPLAEPVGVKLVTRGGVVTQGEAVAFNTELAVVRLESGAEERVPWSSLFPAGVFQTYRQLMDQKDAQQWLELGRLLRALPGGGEHSDSALQVAEMLDAKLKEDVAAVRAIEAPPESAARVEPRVQGSAPLSAAALRAADAAAPAEGPAVDLAQFTWGSASALEQQVFIEEAKLFGAHVAEKLGVQFTAIETKYFIYYTSLPPNMVYQSPLILDQMYDKACELYHIPKGANIFKGKCIVFMFATQGQFKKYVEAFGGHAWAAGFCQNSSTGEVRIVMFQGEDRGYTTQTMLHETVHGVNWRYRRPMVMPPWVEEGVAEWVASNTTGNFRYVNAKKRIGVEHLRQTKQLGASLFEGGISETWQYGVSYDLVNTLIGRDKDKFVGFINAIKDGQPWEWALQEHYGWTVPDLLEKYGRAIGVPELKQ